ncbi:MAG: dihydrofolate reductase family protein [Gemmatimonadaceae bacterium]
MRRVSVFNQISLDGYFTDDKGGMSWAHEGSEDPEFKEFVAGNARGGESTLVFGRITYQLMESFWPTPQAIEQMPVVAEGMNRRRKVVFSKTLDTATWQNTTLVKTDPVDAVKKMKQESGEDMVIMGSGTIISQLADAGLIDAYQFVLSPLALGKGRTMFEGVTKRLDMKQVSERAFKNGKIVLGYESTN